MPILNLDVNIEDFLTEKGILHGDKAVETAGMPYELASQLFLHNCEIGSSMAFRVGIRQRYDCNSSPKSTAVTTKTSDQPIVRGFIPMNAPELSRIGADGKPLGLHNNDIKRIVDGKQEVAAIYLPLYSALSDERVRYRAYNDGRLYLRAKTPPKGVDGFRGNFLLNLQDENRESGNTITSVHLKSDLCNNEDKSTKINQLLAFEPDPSKRKDILSKMQNIVPIYFSREDTLDVKKFAPILALSQNEKLITGDWDLFFVSCPWQWIQKAKQNNLEINKPYNAFKPDEKLALLDKTEEYFKYLLYCASDKQQNNLAELTAFDKLLLGIADINNISDEKFLIKVGVVTPFELLMIMLVNYSYGNKEVLAYRDKKRDNKLLDAMPGEPLIQHGAENRSPKPASAPGKVLFFCAFGVFLLPDEEALAELMQALPGYLDEHVIDIPNTWNAAVWEPVIDKMLKSEQNFNNGKVELKHA